MKLSFTIPYPATKKGRSAWAKQYGFNAVYAGKHWAKRKQDSDYWHSLVKAELRRQGLGRKPFDKPVRITFWWNDGLDLDNTAYMRKLIIDGMKDIVITDDDKRYVVGLCDKIHAGNEILVEVAPYDKR